jgi:hypothetical protein
MDKIETVVVDAKADAKKAEAVLSTVEQDVTATKSWLSTNWHYAVAIAVGFLFLGIALGMKLGAHIHA